MTTVKNGNGNGNGKNGKTGRPCMLTPEIQESVIKAVAAGCYLKHAAMYAGVSYDSVNLWAKRGKRESSGIFFDFYQSLKKAEGNAIVRNVGIIENAANKTWQAAAWWLERRYPDDFALKMRQELTGKDGGPISMTVVVTSPKAKELVQKTMEGHGTD